MENLEILYRDEHIVACDKPSGLLVHRSNIDAQAGEYLLQKLRDQLGQFIYPIHRLDKPASGLILFAFSSDIAAKMKEQMEKNLCTKEYIVVCRGYAPEAGLIDHPLRPINDFKNKNVGKYLDKPAQEAKTLYRRLATREINIEVDRYPSSRYSLVLAQLLTGRKHQIRRHFKHLSHPIIGCPKYGKSKHNQFFADYFGAKRLLLHSYRMVMSHPVSGNQLIIKSPPDGQYKNVLDQLEWLEHLP